MKVRSEDILKPDAILKVEKIDWDSPEVKKLVRCKLTGRPKRRTQKYYDNLRKVITL